MALLSLHRVEVPWRVAIVWVALAFACGGADVDPDTPLSELAYRERGVLFVDPGDLRAWMEAGHATDVVFVDNRNEFSFRQQRIEGARLVPTGEVRQSVGGLPLNKWLVMYCT
ncbi:MAG: hypothetical protein R3199_05210 [Gemmatimonadota bacterium]|nr:hypothetical protein [Gemmatimonadota bacterium]